VPLPAAQERTVRLAASRLEIGIVRSEQGRDGGVIDAAGPVESERTLVSGD
jgi:hypothetical protein